MGQVKSTASGGVSAWTCNICLPVCVVREPTQTPILSLQLATVKVLMSFSDSFFAARFGLTRRDLENYLSEALSRGGDYADLYFEYLATSSISIDESIVKSATQGVTLGVGGRVLAGERTRFSYSGGPSPPKNSP